MITTTYSATLLGLQPIKIEIEVDSRRGVPKLILIGLPTKAIEESKERITSALTNCGVRIRNRRTIVNLAPADLKKKSPIFELAIAVALLKMYGEIQLETDHTLFFGELSLDGQLKSMKGALPLVAAAAQMGYRHVILPAINAAEVSLIDQINIYPLKHLQTLLQLSPNTDWAEQSALPSLPSQQQVDNHLPPSQIDFQHVVGQSTAKRALEIAATGGHNVLLIGPPGAGKTLLAKTMPSILPPLSKSEIVTVTTLYSILGLNQHQLITHRPFRAPHHSASYVGLIGGGHQLTPGEISLAHHGILFLDEFSEFDRRSLESLRQPLEEGQITIVRAQGSATYPASFTLIAAANPCPCGWHGSTQRECRCSQHARLRYQQKFSGPILDRIDLYVRVQPVKLNKLTSSKSNKTESSASIRHRVKMARLLQQELLQPTGHSTLAQLNSDQVRTLIQLNSKASQLLTSAAHRLKLSARSYFRVIKVAQTIAHLDQQHQIATSHVTEALQYRQEIVF